MFNNKTISKKRIRRNYNRISGLYDVIAWPFEKKLILEGLAELDVRKEEKVLEIGFGTGGGIVRIAQSVGENGRVCGVDMAEEMCRTTIDKLERSCVRQRTDIICGDAGELPFISDRFDAVFMSFTLELFSRHEMHDVLKECLRVLKRNGRLCVVALAKKPESNMITRLYERVHRLFPEFVDCRPIDVRQYLHDTGFIIDRTIERKLMGIPVDIVCAHKR